MIKRTFFLILVASVISVLIVGGVFAANKIKKSKNTEVKKLAYAGLDLFCLANKYDPSRIVDGGYQPDTAGELKILKKYGFKSQTIYEKMLDRYEKNPKLAESMQKIVASKQYQKKYLECMVLSAPPDQREQTRKDLGEIQKAFGVSE